MGKMDERERKAREYRRDRLDAVTLADLADTDKRQSVEGWLSFLESKGKDTEFVAATRSRLTARIPEIQPGEAPKSPAAQVQSEGKDQAKPENKASEGAKEAVKSTKSLLELLSPGSDPAELVGGALYEIASEAGALASLYMELPEADDVKFMEAWNLVWKGRNEERARKAMNSAAKIWAVAHPESFKNFEDQLRGKGKGATGEMHLGAMLPELMSLVVFGAILYKALSPFVKMSIADLEKKEKALEDARNEKAQEASS